MPAFSVYVALFDFLPVLVSAVAMAWLAIGIGQRHHGLVAIAWLGAVLIPLGGLAKASWKLILATGGPDISWLENLLFICLAPGFVMLAFALLHARRAWLAAVPPHQARYPGSRLILWLVLVCGGALTASLVAPDGRIWFFWLLAMTTLANAALLLQALITARFAELGWPVMVCFIYSFAAVLAMSGLSRLPDTEASAWIQECVNLSAQVALALGFWRLGRTMHINAESAS